MHNLQIKLVSLFIVLLDKITFGLKINPKKITHISYRDDKLTYSMKMISNSLRELDENYEQVYLPMKFDNTLFNKIKYFFEIIKQIIHIKTSQVVIIDGNNIVISNLKESDKKVIQIWHASSAIKKFGHDYKRKFEMTKCDYMMTASSKSIEIMSSAFNIKKDRVIPLGYIESDVLFNEEKMKEYRENMYQEYPELKGKKIILYAPTFRGDAIYEKGSLSVDLNKIIKSLDDDYVLLYKMHPILAEKTMGKDDAIYNMNNYDIYKLFSITDILVSDFSSVIMDFCILERPIILFTPDLESYQRERGLYIDYKKFAPGTVVYDEEELVNTIKSKKYDIKRIKKIKDEFYDYKDDKSAERIADFIHHEVLNKV